MHIRVRVRRKAPVGLMLDGRFPVFGVPSDGNLNDMVDANYNLSSNGIAMPQQSLDQTCLM